MTKHFKGDLIQVRKNEPIEMPAEITGLPMPKVEWFKDDVLFEKSTERVLIETKVIDRLTEHTKLAIPTIARLDKGIYTVTASNRLGTVSHNITVEVLGKLTHGHPVIVQLLEACGHVIRVYYLIRSSNTAKKSCSFKHPSTILPAGLGCTT